MNFENNLKILDMCLRNIYLQYNKLYETYDSLPKVNEIFALCRKKKKNVSICLTTIGYFPDNKHK